MSVQPRDDAKKPGKPAQDQHKSPKSDIEISQAAHMRPIVDVAAETSSASRRGLMPYGHYKAKISLDYIAGLADRPDGKLILVTAITPDPGRRGQDHDHGRPRRCAEPDRQEGDRLHPRALARTLLRHEGRRGRRRLCPGRADGGHQSPFHRRLPRDRRRQQPARSNDRQPRLLGQQARHRHPARQLAPRRRHERPGAARKSLPRSAALPTAFRARPASTSPSRRR